MDAPSIRNRAVSAASQGGVGGNGHCMRRRGSPAKHLMEQVRPQRVKEQAGPLLGAKGRANSSGEEASLTAASRSIAISIVEVGTPAERVTEGAEGKRKRGVNAARAGERLALEQVRWSHSSKDEPREELS